MTRGLWLLFTVLAGCGRTGRDDSVALPLFAQEERVAVGLTRDGRILYEGRAVSLDELARALSTERTPRLVEVRADRNAIWCHVAWVLGVVAEQGHTDTALLAVVGPEGREEGVPIRVHSAFFVPETGYTAVRVWPDKYGLLAVPPWSSVQPSDAQSQTETRETENPAQLTGWLREKGATPCAIEPHARASVHRCLAALAACHGAGIRDLEWGIAVPHPWVREQGVLPIPGRDIILARWFPTDLRQQDLGATVLPVAPMAVPDRGDDPDGRLIVTLDGEGRVLFKGEVTLDELAKRLAESARNYDLKMQALGKAGRKTSGGRDWSRLYVLLNAHKDAPWQHVRWILGVLQEQGFYKLQFGVWRAANLAYTEKEAERLGIPREERVPRPWGDEAKLEVFLPTSSPRGATRIWLRMDEGRVAYDVDGREVRDITDLTKELRRRRVEIDAPPGLPLKYVVAVVSRLAEAGVDEIGFAGVTSPPPEVRARAPLPNR